MTANTARLSRCHFGPFVATCNESSGALTCISSKYELYVGKGGKHGCKRESSPDDSTNNNPTPYPRKPAALGTPSFVAL